jgi:predicted DNA binding CopG/RHH family protein
MKDHADKKLKKLIKNHFPSNEYEEVSKEEEREIDESLGLLKPVTIRLQPHLIEILKILAEEDGLKYQSLVRSILTKYVNRRAKKAG